MARERVGGMISIVYTDSDPVSHDAALRIISDCAMRDEGNGVHRSAGIELRCMGPDLLGLESLDSLGASLIIFLSRHTSSAGVSAFTVHAEGNWGEEARLGGKPHSLSVASPYAMLCVLKLMSESGSGIEKTYEATHHGPLLNTPSLFAEFGAGTLPPGNSALSGELGLLVYRAALMVDSRQESAKAVIGIGGGHYPSKFTRLAIEKGYAFGHIMPRHALASAKGGDNLSMIEQAVQRSATRPECAVIEWKSIDSQTRSRVIKKLDSIGIEHERV